VFKRQTGLVGDIELFPDWEAVSSRLKDGTLSAGVLHGFEFAWARQVNPDLQPLIVSNRTNRSSRRGIVVNGATSRRDSSRPIWSARALVVSKGLKAHCHLYYENLRKGFPANVLQPTGPAKGMAEDAITAVLLGEAEAAARRLRRDQELPGDAARPREETFRSCANPNRPRLRARGEKGTGRRPDDDTKSGTG